MPVPPWPGLEPFFFPPSQLAHIHHTRCLAHHLRGLQFEAYCHFKQAGKLNLRDV